MDPLFSFLAPNIAIITAIILGLPKGKEMYINLFTLWMGAIFGLVMYISYHLGAWKMRRKMIKNLKRNGISYRAATNSGLYLVRVDETKRGRRQTRIEKKVSSF